MKTLLAAAAFVVYSTTASAVPVPYCSVNAVQGLHYVRWANNPTPGVTTESLCQLAESELRFNMSLTPSGARSWGYIDNSGANYAWVKCQDGFVQYVNGFGLNILQIANQALGQHYQCLMHINHNG
jgi:hypothetical protein